MMEDSTAEGEVSALSNSNPKRMQEDSEAKSKRRMESREEPRSKIVRCEGETRGALVWDVRTTREESASPIVFFGLTRELSLLEYVSSACENPSTIA